MNRIAERAYYRSPVLVQNLAVSALGYGLARQRYSKESRRLVALLRRSERLSPNELLEFVNAELRRTIAHAFAHVPYYRELAGRLRLAAGDIECTGDLHKLPLLEKSQIRNRPEAFVCDRSRRKGHLFKLSTSGTSGTPLVIYCDRASRSRHYAFWTRLRGWFGLAPETPRATFFGRVVCAQAQLQPPFWRYDYFQRNYLFSSYHLTAANLPSYYEALLRAQPAEVIGYPSSLFVLAAYMVAEGLRGVRPKVVFTTAETLLSHQREILEQAFGAPVVDQYGCTEMALFVSQCEKGSYHVHSEHGVVEVLGPSGEPVPDGTPGEAVCTGFVNMAMPLLRYRLGDQIVADGTCTCGRSLPVLSDIVGRVEDTLVTPSGRPLGRLDPVFKPLHGIRETQILQTSVDRLLVRIVIDVTFSRADREALLYELHKRTGDEMTIDLAFVDQIPKGPNGKFRAVISLLGRDAPPR